MKQSKIKRLIPKKLARQIAAATGSSRSALEAVAEKEAASTVAKMRGKGYHLVTRLESGEGVFVRDDDVVSLHVQLPTSLYRRLHEASRQREATKRDLVTAALEAYLED